MSRNPYQRNNNRGQQQPPSQSSRPIANPYAARNNSNSNNNRSDNGSSHSGSGRSALSLMTGPLPTNLPQGIVQEPSVDRMTTTAANSTHTHSTTNSSNPCNSNNNNHNNNHNHSYDSTTRNYNDVDRIGHNAQHDFDGTMNHTNVNNDTSNQQSQTANNNVNDTNANQQQQQQQQQIQELQQQLQAMRQRLEEQSETNFDLNATIATLQAEMDHTLQTSTQQHKEESSKLQHLLRLEQQKSRRLEAQHQQRTQQQDMPPMRKRPASQSVFTKRLEAQAGMTAAPAIPQNISLPTTTTTNPVTTTNAAAAAAAAAAALSPPPQAPTTPPRKQPIRDPPPTATATTFSISKQKSKTTSPAHISSLTTNITTSTQNTSASRLAQHILQSILLEDDSSSFRRRRRRSRKTDDNDNDKDNNKDVSTTVDPKVTEKRVEPSTKKDSYNETKSDETSKDVEMTTTEVQASQEEAPPSPQPQFLQVQRVLVDIASGGGNGSWSEVQLVEYILRQENAWEFWYPALFKSRLGKIQLLQAMEQRHEELSLLSKQQQQQQKQQQGDDPMVVDQDSGATVKKASGRSRVSRITRLGQAGGKAKLDSSLETEIWNSLLDPWWDPNTSVASIQATVQARLSQQQQQQQHQESSSSSSSKTTTTEPTVDPTTIISPSLAYTWMQKLVESSITKHNHQQDNQYPALRLLHTVLEESNDTHDQTALWEICHQPMEQVLEGLYRQWMLEMTKLIKEETAKGGGGRGNYSSSSISSRMPYGKSSKKKGDLSMRRLEAAKPPVEELLSMQDDREIGDIESCLALTLAIWKALVSSTTTKILDLWIQEEKGGGGARMVSIVLDMLEEHEHLYDKQNRPRHPTCYSIKGWYLDAISFLSTVGTSKSGMDVLRTRTHPSNVPSSSADSYWMGNTLDVAIRQLFSLVMDQEQDTRKRYYDQDFRMRTLAIEGWVRLWHQVLLFVQDQQLPDNKQPVALSFRSLVLDHQNWYTSAYAMLLADQDDTRQDIQAMIRLQLEELSMDEEEYEELRGH